MQFAKSHKYKKGKDLGREKCKKVKSSRTYFCMLMDQNGAKLLLSRMMFKNMMRLHEIHEI